MTTRRKNSITKPKPKINLSASPNQNTIYEPRTVNQALKDKLWRACMSDELDAFARNQTLELIPCQTHQNIVGCRWLYKNQYFANGRHRCRKFRLVAKGYNQERDRDYNDTFSPVIKTTTIRLILDIAVTCSWPVLQLDVNNAFLQGTLDDEVYMEQLPGFIDPDNPTHVCRLRKAIYGLKQAPRAWYMELKRFLESIGFVNSLADTSMFVLRKGNDSIYLLVYVDDILVTGSSKSMISQVLKLLSYRFSVKDPEDLNYFLGVEERTKGCIFPNGNTFLISCTAIV